MISTNINTILLHYSHIKDIKKLLLSIEDPISLKDIIKINGCFKLRIEYLNPKNKEIEILIAKTKSLIDSSNNSLLHSPTLQEIPYESIEKVNLFNCTFLILTMIFI